MRSLLILITACVSISLNAQTILYLDWNSNPVTQASTGPNATSVSSSAVSSAGGTGGTNGLNPGLPKADLDMVFTGSPDFDVRGIDIQFDFQRDESVGDFFTRTGFDLGMNGGNLRVNFNVDDGAGGSTTVNSGNVYSIPNDNTFRTYRFFYLPDVGQAELQVNGTTVWSYSGTPGRDLVWSGGDVVIGNNMDGSGSNNVILDNFIVGSVTSSPLPVELLDFAGEQKTNTVQLNWSTASETNNHYFKVERSLDGINFDETVAFVEGMGNSSHTVQYNCVDEEPVMGYAYYRLSQTDYDGVTEIFDPIVVLYENVDELVEHTTGSKRIYIISDQVRGIKLFNLMGQETRVSFDNQTAEVMDPSAHGTFVIIIETQTGNHVSKKIVI